MPADMLPAAAVWVRMSCDAEDMTQPVFFQVTGYEYDATLDAAGPDGPGRTAALTVLGEDAALDVTPQGRAGDQAALTAQVTNRGAQAVALQPRLQVQDPQGGTVTVAGKPLLLAAGASSRVSLPYETAHPGRYLLDFTLGPRLRTHLATDAQVCVLDVSAYGEALPSPDRQVALWWATSGWKVGRTRPAPANQGSAAVIRLARNETEGAQIVVRPDRALRNLTATVGALRNAAGAALPAAEVQVLAVDYVNVEGTSDEFGRTGLWPDPLPPLTAGVDVPAGSNQPLWINVHTPAETRPGRYQGQVTLFAEGFKATVPLQVEVFGFALPADSTCRTLFGFNPGNVIRYHNLKTDEQRRLVMDKYLRSFADHRLSPYDPAPLDGFNVKWLTGSRWNGGRLVTDNPHSGRAALLSEDNSTTGAPQASYAEPLPLGTAPLRLRLWYRTAGAGPAMFVLAHQDAAHNHIANQNKHALLPASGDWRQAEFTFANPPEGARFVVPSFLGCEWNPNGEKTGSVWVDEVSLVDTATGQELVADGGFEQAVPVAGAELVRFDWTGWDQAMDRAVKEYHFNSFVFNVPGLGGGTFYERYPGELCGYKEGTPEYAALLKAWCTAAREHLQAKGLLDRAAVYPFDEPDVKDHPFVASQLRRLKDNFPGLHRMVPMDLAAADDLVGLVDRWCPIMNSHRPDFAAARHQAGELYTWYICCGPKAPYIANFIDRPGTDLRLWLWQTWQEGVDGLLIWESTWWTSGAAYPDTP
ncbi:MAG: glycoside hydrolase domain-containing protein, partial [Armatimonadota bacterium]